MGSSGSRQQQQQAHVAALLSAVAALARDTLGDEGTMLTVQGALQRSSSLSVRLSERITTSFLNFAVEQNSVVDVRDWLADYADRLNGGAIWLEELTSAPSTHHQQSNSRMSVGQTVAGSCVTSDYGKRRLAVGSARSTSQRSSPRTRQGLRDGRSLSPAASQPQQARGALHSAHPAPGRSVSQASYETHQQMTVRSASTAVAPSTSATSTAAVHQWTSVVSTACRQLNTLASPLRLRLECLHTIAATAVEHRAELVRQCGAAGSTVSIATCRLVPLLTYQLMTSPDTGGSGNGGEKQLTRLVLQCINAVSDMFSGVLFTSLGREGARGLFSAMIRISAGGSAGVYYPSSYAVVDEARQLLNSLVQHRTKGEEMHVAEVCFAFLRKAHSTPGSCNGVAVEDASGLNLIRAMLLQLLYRLLHPGRRGGAKNQQGHAKRIGYAIGRTISRHVFVMPVISEHGLSDLVSSLRQDDDHLDEEAMTSRSSASSVAVELLKQAVGHFHHIDGESGPSKTHVSIVVPEQHSFGATTAAMAVMTQYRPATSDKSVLMQAEEVKSWASGLTGCTTSEPAGWKMASCLENLSSAAVDARGGPKTLSPSKIAGSSLAPPAAAHVQGCSVHILNLKPLIAVEHPTGKDEEARLSAAVDVGPECWMDDLGKQFFLTVVAPLLLQHASTRDECSLPRPPEIAAIFSACFPRTACAMLHEVACSAEAAAEVVGPNTQRAWLLFSTAVRELLRWADQGHDSSDDDRDCGALVNGKSLALLRDGWQGVVLLPARWTKHQLNTEVGSSDAGAVLEAKVISIGGSSHHELAAFFHSTATQEQQNAARSVAQSGGMSHSTHTVSFKGR